MSAREQYVVGPAVDSDGWEVTRDGERLGCYTTQRDGIDTAVRICKLRLAELRRLSELTIKRPNGEIRDKRTYGKDPRSSKG